MLTSKCSKVDAILFTHEHADHTSGVDDIRPFNFMQGKIPVYAHPRVIENLKKRFDYIFETENRYPGAPSVQAIEVKNNIPFIIGDIHVVPINAYHANLQVFGYKMNDFVLDFLYVLILDVYQLFYLYKLYSLHFYNQKYHCELLLLFPCKELINEDLHLYILKVFYMLFY
jgi:hypothetical protein